jgi:hypothetical protein
MGGEIGGALLPMLVPGAGEVNAARIVGEGAELANVAREGATVARTVEGGSALAKAGRAATAIPRGVSSIGEATERGVASVIGEGSTNILARTAQTAIRKGAGSAVEGALFGMGNQISEDALGNHELSGEKLLAAAGHGFLLGGAFGGALGTAGELASPILKRAGGKVSEIAETQAFRSTNARKAFTDAAERIPGGLRGVGREMLDSGLVRFGDDVEKLAPKLRTAADEAGEKVSSLYEQADNAGFEGPRIAEVRKRVEREVIAPLRKLASVNGGAIRTVEGLLDDFALAASRERDIAVDAAGQKIVSPEARATFQGIHGFRRDVDNMIRWSATNPLAPVPIRNETLKDLRGILQDEVERAGDEASRSLGRSFRDEVKAANLKFRRLNVAADAAEDSVTRMHANASHSLTDKLAGATVGAAELAAHGPVGLVAGVAASQASKLVRERGNASLAVMLDRFAGLAGVRRAAVQIDGEINGAVKGYLEGGATRGKARVRYFKTSDDEYKTRADAVSHAAANDNGTRSREAVLELAPHAPKTAAAFDSAARRATSFLASKLPQGHAHVSSLTPQFDTPRVSDAEKAKWMRYATAVDDPMSVLHDLQTGAITREQVEALKTVYQNLYQQIRTQVMQGLSEQKEPVPYAKRLQLGILLDVPADASLSPGFIASMQANYAPSKKGPGPSAPSVTPKRPITKVASLEGLDEDSEEYEP